jgi:hypothetical protein
MQIIDLNLPSKIPKSVANKFKKDEINKKRKPTPVPIPKEKEFLLEKYEISKMIHLDSRNRDTTLFPKACDCVLNMPQTCTNIKSIELHSIELPNGAQVINNTNNVLYFENQFERDLRVNTVSLSKLDNSTCVLTFDLPHNLTFQKRIYIYNVPGFIEIQGYRTIKIIDDITLHIQYDMSLFLGTFVLASVDLGTPIYSVTLVNGNYSLTSICSQLQNQISSVLNTIDDTFHPFLITPNIETDIIKVRQFKTRSLDNNPINTTINSNFITVLIVNHGFQIGDTIILFNIVPVANYIASVLNGVQIITQITNTSITFQTTTQATATTAGGGNTVLLGSLVNFKLIFNPIFLTEFDSNTYQFGNTIDINLGFVRETSSVELPVLPSAVIFTLFHSESNSIDTSVPGKVVFKLTEPVSILKKCFTIQLLNLVLTTDQEPVLLGTTNAPHNLTERRSIYINSNSVVGFFDIIPTSTTTFFSLHREQLIVFESAFTTGFIQFGGDSIRINNLDTSPSISNQKNYFITDTDTIQNTITINETINMKSQQNFSNVTILTKKLKITDYNHNFNTINNISYYTTSRIKITTFLPFTFSGNIIENISFNRNVANYIDFTIINHNLATQSKIYIENVNINEPSLIGSFVISVIDSDTIQILYPGVNTLSGVSTINIGDRIIISNTNCSPQLQGVYGIDTMTSGTDDHNFYIFSQTNLLQSGTFGTLNWQNQVTLSRTTGYIPNYPFFDKCSLQTYPIELIDTNSYYLSTDFFADTNTMENINNVKKSTQLPFISSERHGFNSTQSNTFDWTENTPLYKRITLQGENYIFLCSQAMATQSLKFYSGNTENNPINNIFSKIQLDTLPGSVTYFQNMFKPIMYSPTILSLGNIDLQLYQFNGNFFDILNLDWSLSLLVVEEHIKIASSQRHSTQGTLEKDVNLWS